MIDLILRIVDSSLAQIIEKETEFKNFIHSFNNIGTWSLVLHRRKCYTLLHSRLFGNVNSSSIFSFILARFKRITGFSFVSFFISVNLDAGDVSTGMR